MGLIASIDPAEIGWDIAALAVLLGFQLVCVLRRGGEVILRLRKGCKPEDESFDRWFKFVTRETGLIVACLLVLLGWAWLRRR